MTDIKLRDGERNAGEDIGVVTLTGVKHPAFKLDRIEWAAAGEHSSSLQITYDWGLHGDKGERIRGGEDKGGDNKGKEQGEGRESLGEIVRGTSERRE